jgi:hypothetical protein
VSNCCDQIKEDEVGRACNTRGAKRNAYRNLVGMSEGLRPLGRHRNRWEDDINIDLKQIGWDNLDCFHLPQDRNQWRALVTTAMKLRVP